MKVLIVSDTHGAKKNMDKLKELIINEIDLIIHAGDNFRDSIYLTETTGKSVISVVGNCDFENREDEIEFEVENVKFFLTHGHRYGVKYGLETIAEKCNSINAQIGIFGHTHVKENSYVSGVHLINTGSLSLPRDGMRGSYVIMEINSGKYNIDFRFI